MFVKVKRGSRVTPWSSGAPSAQSATDQSARSELQLRPVTAVTLFTPLSVVCVRVRSTSAPPKWPLMYLMKSHCAPRSSSEPGGSSLIRLAFPGSARYLLARWRFAMANLSASASWPRSRKAAATTSSAVWASASDSQSTSVPTLRSRNRWLKWIMCWSSCASTGGTTRSTSDVARRSPNSPFGSGTRL